GRRDLEDSSAHHRDLRLPGRYDAGRSVGTMVRRRRTTAAPVFAAAAATYAANCALGAATAAGVVDTSGFRWLHHALYGATCVAVTAALSAVRWGVPRRASRRAALMLAPAAIPLAA